MSSLTHHTARFATALRRHDIDVNVGDETDALTALALVDIADPDEVLLALRISMKIDRGQWNTFNLLFDRMWRRAGSDTFIPAPDPPTTTRERAPFALRREATGDASAAAEPARHTSGGYSPEATLREKSFDECTEDDLRTMRRALERLARKLATRHSRRLVPSPKRGMVDLRRSLRRAPATDGDILEIARRRRAIERPHIVLLCDTSGSMDAYSRFLLAFSVSLKRVAPRTEAFVFNTRLTPVSRWISPANFMATLERFARGVDDWSGGTRIGACLGEFVDDWMPTVVAADTTVVILSDGLDRGDIEVLEHAMRRLQRRARRIVWLNPLAGDHRYAPAAKGMKAALPYIDRLAPAHNLAALENLLPLLT